MTLNTLLPHTYDDGVTYIPVYNNGYYETVLYTVDYVETKWNFAVECYDEYTCVIQIQTDLCATIQITLESSACGLVRLLDSDNVDIQIHWVLLLPWEHSSCLAWLQFWRH